MKRVVVGLSGGVDSSVTAALLVEQGYEVIGLFMRNWHDDTVILDDQCPWVEDSTDAQIVADKLGIPFQTLDLSEQYKERIVNYMFKEYEAGRTPNPDVLCNREIKFDIFLDAALSLGADFVATGHYCQKETVSVNGNEVHRLLAGADQSKDQSYFLCQLNQSQLSKALFPIGHLQKSKVRELAHSFDLITADKKDSQGLCFIGKVSLPDFLKQALEPKQGKVIEIPRDAAIYESTHIQGIHPYKHSPKDGKEVGNHQGAHYYTIGQRKGIGIGGTPLPYFVLEKDTTENVLYVGQGEDHPGLLRNALFIPNEDLHWVRPGFKLNPEEHKEFLVRIRYRQPLFKAILEATTDGVILRSHKPMWSVAAGQFAAWYVNNEVIGSGVID